MFSDVKSLLILTVVAAVVNADSSTYSKTGKCKEKTCIYDYTISGGIHDERAKEESSLSARITLRCESVGSFNGQDAVYYCIDLANVVQKSYEIKIDQKTKQEKSKKLKFSTDVTSTMRNRFCFVRDSNGKLLTVFHPANETKKVVNMKKAIVSTFQANFDKTTEETESDAQSVHKAHYSYKSKGKNTVEHRSVSNQDVVKYSGNAKKKNVDYHSEEDVEIDEENVIRQSSGTSTTSLSKVDKSEEKPQKKDQDIPPIEVKSRYTMKQVKCLSISTMMSLDSDDEDFANKWDYEPVAAALVAEIDEREMELDEMEDLNSKLQDFTEIVKRTVQRRDTSSIDQSHIDKSLQKWRQILHLESKHGVPSGRKSKLNVILDNLKKVSSDDFSHNIHVRLIIYSMLSSEGSLAAQEALLNALKLKERRDEEYDSIVMAIALLNSVNCSTLLDFKKYVMDNMMIDDELLLSFATLGRHKNVEKEVVSTITQLINEQGVNDTESLIYFIHALGNTGSKLIIPHLIPFLMNNNDKDIQLTAIDALRTVSTDKEVQKTFSRLVTSDKEFIDVILAIIESLKFPYESFLYYPEPPEEPEDEEVEKKLLMDIVNATIHFHDDALYNATVECLKTITSSDFTTQLLNELVMRYTKQIRSKRSYSSYWTNRNSIYNSIASYYSRSSDNNRYPYNKALLWAKRMGPSKVHAVLAAGGFAGLGGSGYKVYGKGVFKIYCFGRTYTAVDAEYNGRCSISSRRPTVRKFVKVLGRVYSPRTTTSAVTAAGYSRTWRKNFFRVQLFRFQTSIYIKVGTLSFTVRGTANLDASLNLGLNTLQANAALTIRPSITVTGNAEVNLLLIWKIGVDVSANIGYYISPKATTTLCDSAPRADASSCFGIFHGSRGLRVNVRAYYRRRTCSWWKGCSWTRKTTVNALSTTRTYRRISQQMLWGRCKACNCSGPLNTFCRYVRRGSPSGGAGSCSCRTVRYQS